MSLLKQALAASEFAVTAELAPPKGSDLSHALETAQLLKGKVHGINVTDMQSACLKASSLGLCIHLKNAGLEPILQVTGRDRNRMAILADLLSAYSFGIDTMLALTGDHPVVGDCTDTRPVYDLDSVGILQMLQKAQTEGVDCGGNPLTSRPDFFMGATVTPVYEPLPLQIHKLRQKVDAGAGYIQTQGIFALDSLKRFLEAVRKANITVPIMAGIIPLKSAGMAKYMNENVPGIAVPQEQIDALASARAEGRKPGDLGMDLAAELIAKIREEKLCAGVHIMAIGAEEKVPTILEKSLKE